MREIVVKSYPFLLAYGCSAHYMNLAEKELGGNVIIKHIVEVQKYFRNVHQARGWLDEKGGVVPQLPNETRWNSHFATVETFISNYSKYIEIQVEQNDLSPSITKIISNVMILREANNLLKQMTVVGTALDKLQSDSTYLADAVEIWFDVTECTDLESHIMQFKLRRDQALEPFHYLANITHPQYMGKRLTGAQVI